MQFSLRRNNTLAMLSDATSFLGCSPDRGRSPVEWGDFPSVRSSVRPSVRSFPPSGLKASEAWLAGSGDGDGWTDGWMHGRTYRQTNGRTDGWKISPFYRTSSSIGAAAPLQPNFNPKTV